MVRGDRRESTDEGINTDLGDLDVPLAEWGRRVPRQTTEGTSQNVPLPPPGLPPQTLSTATPAPMTSELMATLGMMAQVMQNQQEQQRLHQR
jgi:hypothetical protein